MKTGIRFLLFFIITSTFTYMLYVPYQKIKQQTIEKLNEKQMLIAKQASRGMENFFNEQISRLHDFASSPEIITLTEYGKESIARSYINNSKYITAITRYDANGTILYSYPNPENVVGRNISNQPHVQRILQSHKSTVSDVFTSIQGYQSVALSEPVLDGENFVGVIAFLIDFKYIAKTYLEVIQIGDKGYAWMISRDGVELFCPVPGHVGVNIAKTSAEFPTVIDIADRMKEGKSGYGTYTYDMSKGEKVETITKHAAYVPIHILDSLWSIAVATPESEAYSELHSFYGKMIISFILLFGSLVVLGFIMIKDFNLGRINRELEIRVASEMEKRKQQEKLMLQQARFYSMGETLNAIAHQWRQPLNSIGLCVQDLEDAYRMGQLDEKYLADTIDSTMKNIGHLSDTIDDFRNFFSSDEKLVKDNVCSLLFRIHNIVRAQFDAVDIKFVVNMDGTTISSESECDINKYSAEIYPDMLKQVILNCLQNSREAIEKRVAEGKLTKGEISINLIKNGSEYTVEIIDNGGGIPAGLQEKIFDPYFSTKDIHIGMGMGLYTAKGIMEGHMNGTIKVYNHDGGAKVVIKFKTA